MAWFGPCISQRHYEVGSEIFDEFTNQNKSYAQAFKSKEGCKYLFDMKSIAKHILNENRCVDIIDSSLCTYSDIRFYSHRKDSKTGRQASFIFID